MTRKNKDEVLRRASSMADQYLAAIKFDGKHNLNAIAAELSKATFKGKRCLGLAVPSPADAAPAIVFGAAVMQQRDQLRGQLRGQLEGQLEGQLGSQLGSQLWGQLWDQLGSQLGSQLWDQLGGQLRGQLRNQLGSQLEGQLEDQLGSQLGSRLWGQLRDQLGGIDLKQCIWDYYLSAFYGSATAAAGIDNEFTDSILLAAHAAGMGFLINLGGLRIGVALPEAYRDDQMQIHRETGPAIIWGEAKQYWWHGTKVPGEWIEDKGSVDPSLVLTHDNIEQRRALCEIIGWDKVLTKIGARLLQSDSYGELLQADLPDAPGCKFVKVVCGTGRTFAIPVPPEMETAHQAVAWTYGLETKDYSPEVRT